MKQTGRYYTYFVLLYMLISGYGNQTFGQEKFNISAGLGFPDLLNIGTRYQLKQNTLQLGVNAGIGVNICSLSSDLFYHFAGYSGFSSRPPWYIKGGLTFINELMEENSDRYLLFNLRLGRDINLSEKAGLNLEAGVVYSPWAEVGWMGSGVLPGFGISFFYRL
jgi:hypothetical protein